MLHKVLQRQLKKLGYKDGKFTKGSLEDFINIVDKTYKEADEEREFLEQTLEINSKEMEELYEELKQKSESEIAKREQKYRELARKDILTGILNRYAFGEELEKIISNSKRTGAKFALLFLDLDHFKEINDTFGHAFGDELLVEIAKRVLPNIRKEDVFARLGGDEFVIIFTNIKEESILELIKKILCLFLKPWIIDKKELHITTSIGVAIFPDDATSSKELMQKADMAMYKSKEIGRNRVVFYKDFKNYSLSKSLGYKCIED